MSENDSDIDDTSFFNEYLDDKIRLGDTRLSEIHSIVNNLKKSTKISESANTSGDKNES